MYRGLLVLVVSLLVNACSSQPVKLTEQDVSPSSTTEPAANSADSSAAPDAFSSAEEYRIGVDDKVLVSVWGNEQLTITVPVRPDGRISLPLIGDVRAGGHTPAEVAADVEAQLASFVREPKVSVILLELNSHEFISRVRITGAVRSPQSLPYRQGMTVLDLVLLAGGPNEFASASRTRLYRRNPNDDASPTALDVNLDAILNQGRMASNYTLLPGDVITVPERLF